MSPSNILIHWSPNIHSFHPKPFEEFCPIRKTEKYIGIPSVLSVDNMLVSGERTPLLKHDWRNVSPILSKIQREEWQYLNDQRQIYFAYERPLRCPIFEVFLEKFISNPSWELLGQMVASQADNLTSFGYPIAHVPHMQQTATLLKQQGASSRLVAIGLIHDLAFITCNELHGELVADLLQPWLTHGEYFLIKHHAIVQSDICEHKTEEQKKRFAFQDSPFFEETCQFVYYFDSIANSEELPMESLKTLSPHLSALMSTWPGEEELNNWRNSMRDALSNQYASVRLSSKV